MTRSFAAGAALLGFLGNPVVAQASLLHKIVAHIPLVVQVSNLLGPAPLFGQVHLVVNLPYPNPGKVEQFVRVVNDPHSPEYHHFVTQKQFADNFGPNPHWYSQVEYVLGAGGLKTVKRYANRKVLEVEGTLLSATVLLTTLVNQYSVQNLKFNANGLPAGLPLELLGTVESVAGLSTYALKLAQLPTVPGTNGYGPADIQTAYNEPIHTKPSLNGKGVTIAIETAGDYMDSDLQAYWKAYGVNFTGSIQRVVVNNPSHRSLALSEETTLDVEQVTANAPGANVIVYEGADGSDATFESMYEQMLSNTQVDVATTSYGACEAASDPSLMQAENELFEEAAAEGKTQFAATGDTGAYDCGTNDPNFGHPGQPNPLTVDFPASSPYVAGAGGTAMHTAADGSIKSERGWSGSGGGVSAHFGLPGYQQTAGLGGKHRSLPDVSLNADPNTPYELYFQGSQTTVGGTSPVAPNLAALWAQFVQATGKRQGLAQGELYAGLADGHYPGKAFNDILKGDNQHYQAGRGYDNVTGVGSLDGSAFLQMLQRH